MREGFRRWKAPSGVIHVVPRGWFSAVCGQVPGKDWKPSRVRCGTCVKCAAAADRFKKTGRWTK